MINHRRTMLACFGGMGNQAIYSNMTAVLFVPFMKLYGFTLAQLGVLIGINYATQLIADIILTFFIDRVKYKNIVQISNILGTVGMTLFCIAPLITPNNPYIMLAISTIIFSFAGGMLEVIISPIIDTIPDDFKSKKTAMTLAHSMYAWGQVLCVAYMSLCIYAFGYKNWQYIVAGMIVMPILNFAVFNFVKIAQYRTIESKKHTFEVLKSPVFILCGLAILLGATSEIVMNQYVSAFCELTLGVSKIMADLIGMMLFAFMLGLGRLLYGIFGHKINLNITLIITTALAGASYIVVGTVNNSIVGLIFCVLVGFFVALCWPGVLSIAGEAFPKAGAWIFSFLAITGDIGAAIFPSLAGVIADKQSLSNMFSIMAFAPLVCCALHIAIYLLMKKGKKNQKVVPLKEQP